MHWQEIEKMILKVMQHYNMSENEVKGLPFVKFKEMYDKVVNK